MRTVEEYNIAISEYVSTQLKGKNNTTAKPQTQSKYTAILKGIVPVLVLHGHDEPDERDYEEYRATQLAHNVREATILEYCSKIKAFFMWYKERSKQPSLFTENEPQAVETWPGAETENEPLQAETWPDEPQRKEQNDTMSEMENVPTVESETEILTADEPQQPQVSLKASRKAVGEKKIQVSCYLTPETYGVLRVLAQAKNTSVGAILERCGAVFAKKNMSMYEEVQATLQRLNSLQFQD